MKIFKPLQSVRVIGCLIIALAFLSATTTARGNVYATDIQLNGSLYSITNTLASPVNITYRLNQAATAGVTISILQGNSTVATIAGGTSMGLNTVVWGGTNNSGAAVGGGTYSVSITAGANGFATWTKISLDSTNNVAADPEGIAVDNNTNSPYYGRVLVGCATSGTENGVAQQCGIYKMNADGSAADEGSFGYGGYTTNDAGDTASGEMNNGGGPGYNPWRLRIGDDDRLYMDDYSDLGAIVAFDIRVTTNQIVINESGYSGNPDVGDLIYGINNFDVTSTTTANAAVWLCDVDPPNNWGIWMYHMKNGVADPADTKGTQAVIQAANSDLSYGSSGGCMVDTNLDIFVSQYPFYNYPVLRTMDYTNWNHGVLPPEAGGSTYAYGTKTNQVFWGVGTNDATFEGVQDTVINNRQHPTMIALPMAAGEDDYPGIRVLNTTNGSVITVTNGGGSTIQALTNLDYPNQYTCAAWDNVGNLYGASSSAFYWRVWSPPGSNQATTMAVAQVVIPTPFIITGITATPTTPGCSTVTITFTAPGNLAPSKFEVIGSATVNGSYSKISATISGGSGVYQATFSNCSTEFYQIEEPGRIITD